MVAAPELDDAPYVHRKDLVRSSRQLADHPFFESWGFDPMKTSVAMLTAPPPSGSRLTDRQYRPLMDLLVFEPSVMAQLRQRLRRQAWVLERAGDLTERDQALATAAALGRADPDELFKQPFLRRLVERSVTAVVSGLSELFPPQ